MNNKKTLLVIGGCGYIGSHMVKCLLDANYEVVVLDNLSAGYQDSLLGGELVVGDYGDISVLTKLFSCRKFDGVFHFASLIQVGESMVNPGKYYKENVAKTLILLDAMKDYRVGPLIFSSSASVFGEPIYIPIDEAHPLQPINPYGMSKYMIEVMMRHFDYAYGLRYAALRYFNAAGADPQARIGEQHVPETHLIPLALQVALGRQPILSVFGRDYDTIDGTCVRDYIHVEDLVNSHLLALEYLWRKGKSMLFNLGNGNGFSVQQVIDTVERITGKPVPIRYAPRRPGDPARLVADSSLAKSILGWKPRYSELDIIVRHAWQWESKRKR